MSSPKPAKSSDKHAYSVKYSNKTGGAYADMKAVIESERENWEKRKGDKVSCGTNGNKRTDQPSDKKQ